MREETTVESIPPVFSHVVLHKVMDAWLGDICRKMANFTVQKHFLTVCYQLRFVGRRLNRKSKIRASVNGPIIGLYSLAKAKIVSPGCAKRCCASSFFLSMHVNVHYMRGSVVKIRDTLWLKNSPIAPIDLCEISIPRYANRAIAIRIYMKLTASPVSHVFTRKCR